MKEPRQAGAPPRGSPWTRRPFLSPLVVVVLFLTVGVATLLWNAGLPAASNPTRISPEEDPFPLFPAASQLHVLPVPATVNESTRLTLLSIQGLVNRNRAELYLDFDNETGNASSLLTFLTSRYGLTYDVVTMDWVYRHYLPSLAGLVVFDPVRPESVNIVTMLAGLDDAAIAGPDTATYLHARYGLPILLDYGQSNWTSQDAVGAYDRALRELYPQTYPGLLAILPPDQLALRDYLIATRTFVFYEPQGVLASPTEIASTRRVLAAAPRGIPILGWFDSPTLTEENAFVQLASEYGKSVFGSEAVPDLSILTALGRNEVHQQPAPPATPSLENKTYVVVAIPDGDNLDFIANRMRELWAEPERGTFPIAWSLSPLLADLAPPYLDYYYSTASPDDRFVAGPSGAGYLYPDYLGPGDLGPYLDWTSRSMNASGMDVAWLLNAFVASEIPYQPATLSAYVDALRPRGLVLDYDDQAKTQDYWMQAGTASAAPVIRSTQLWTTMDNFFAKVGAAMAAWGSGPHFLWVTVYTFRFDLHDAAAMVQELSGRTGGSVQVVTPEQLFSLMEEDFQVRAEAQLAAMRADPFASTVLAPELNTAQAWLDAPHPAGNPSLPAFYADLATSTLRDASFQEAAVALGFVVIAAALISLVGRDGQATTAGEALEIARPLVPLTAALALFMLALRAALAENFWSYQWILLGVLLAGVGRPFRRYLDRTYPRISLLATVGLDLVFVGLSLGTNVAFSLAAIGTVSVIDAVLAREVVRPRGLVLAVSLGCAAGFLAGIDVLWFGILAILLVAPLAVPIVGRPTGVDDASKVSWPRGFVLGLPLVALLAASNYSLGLRLGLEGSNLFYLATLLLALAPLAGLLAARRWISDRTRATQILAFFLATASATALGLSAGTVITALIFLAFVASLAVAAEATLHIFIGRGQSLASAATSVVSWIPLFLLFFRIPPVVYSLALVNLPEPIEAALYAPQYLFAAVAAILGLVALRKRLQRPTQGPG